MHAPSHSALGSPEFFFSKNSFPRGFSLSLHLSSTTVLPPCVCVCVSPVHPSVPSHLFTGTQSTYYSAPEHAPTTTADTYRGVKSNIQQKFQLHFQTKKKTPLTAPNSDENKTHSSSPRSTRNPSRQTVPPVVPDPHSSIVVVSVQASRVSLLPPPILIVSRAKKRTQRQRQR